MYHCFSHSILNTLFRSFSNKNFIKLLYCFCSFARLKIQATVKACAWRHWVHVRRISKSIFLSKIVYYVISSTYIIKGIEKLVSCIYGVTMHSGNVGGILEKCVKHSATPRVYTLLSYSLNITRVHYHTINYTRLVFYFLNSTTWENVLITSGTRNRSPGWFIDLELKRFHCFAWHFLKLN